MSANVVPFRRPSGGAQPLLERVQKVSKVGTDRWRSMCPAHESKHGTQSLAIRELSDGTVLLKCFAGCGADSIVAAVGLSLRDLFPPNYEVTYETQGSHPEGKDDKGPRKAQRPNMWHAAREAVQTLYLESLIVAIAAENIAAGNVLSSEDMERLRQAATRIRASLGACL